MCRTGNILIIAFCISLQTAGGQLADSLLSLNGQCEDLGDILHIDWDELVLDSSSAPNINLSMSVDDVSLVLTVELIADFVGWASAFQNTLGYGMMYIIDFESLNSATMSIQEVGSCANRNQQSRDMDWDDNWLYSADPDRGVDWGYGAYVGSRHWDITTDHNGECGAVKWTGTWTWYDLMNCTNYAGDDMFVDIEEDTDWVNMTGAVTVNLVSPLDLNANIGYYRVYQLISQPFVIAVHKTVNVVSSTGMNLFVVTLIAVFRTEFTSDTQRRLQNEIISQYILVLVTESADFLMLNKGQILTNPEGFTVTVGNEGYDTSGGCMTSGNLCLQIFNLETSLIPCPTILTGDYNLQFSLKCNPAVTGYDDAMALCLDYIGDDESNMTTLSVDLDWSDGLCDPLIFVIDIPAEIAFYSDDQFLDEISENEQYRPGDRAFVQIVVGDPTALSTVDITLDNVWICTTHPNNEPLTVNENTGAGGCLGGVLDVGYPQHIVQNEAATDNVTLYEPWIGNTIQFSFLIDDDIDRTNLYIHVQATIDVTPEETRRRILLQDGDTASNIAHYVGSVGIGDALQSDDGDGSDNETDILLMIELLGISMAVAFLLFLLGMLIVLICHRSKTQQQMADQMDEQNSNTPESTGSESPFGMEFAMQDPATNVPNI